MRWILALGWALLAGAGLVPLVYLFVRAPYLTDRADSNQFVGDVPPDPFSTALIGYIVCATVAVAAAGVLAAAMLVRSVSAVLPPVGLGAVLCSWTADPPPASVDSSQAPPVSLESVPDAVCGVRVLLVIVAFGVAFRLRDAAPGWLRPAAAVNAAAVGWLSPGTQLPGAVEVAVLAILLCAPVPLIVRAAGQLTCREALRTTAVVLAVLMLLTAVTVCGQAVLTEPYSSASPVPLLVVYGIAAVAAGRWLASRPVRDRGPLAVR